MEIDLVFWLNLVLCWVYVFVGIFWIGILFYFVWLDNNFCLVVMVKDGVSGELWVVYGGGFYYN